MSCKNLPPIVTIGYCVRNSERTIKASLDSILNQDYPERSMKIVIVDGKSTDQTIEIAKKMIEQSGSKSELYSDEGEGLGVARQLVLDHSSGKYVIWIDGDVVVSPTFVAHQVKFMERNPDVGVATGKYVLNRSVNHTLPGVLQGLSKYIGSVRYRQTKEYRGLPPNDASIYRIDISKRVGGFDKSIRGAGEDEDIILRIREAGWLVSMNSRATYYAFSRKDLKSLWGEHVWFGQAKHFIRHKHKELDLRIPIPIVFFIVGLRDGQVAYRLTRLRASFLLPVYYAFGTIAWWFGFIDAHCSGYGH